MGIKGLIVVQFSWYTYNQTVRRKHSITRMNRKANIESRMLCTTSTLQYENPRKLVLLEEEKVQRTSVGLCKRSNAHLKFQ